VPGLIQSVERAAAILRLLSGLSRLRVELEQTAERGWASDVGELFNGFASIAAPIEDRRRVTVGAIGIAGPIERLCDDRRPRAELVDHVIEAARAVSRELGAIPW
jgi:DNA-binding IclR family transcriptional regulator